MLTHPPVCMVAPLGRVMLRTPVLGLGALTAAPAIYAAARGHRDLSFAVTLATIVGAASFALAFDDPAEASLTACPTGRSVRRSMRAGLISISVAGAWVLVAASAHHADYSLEPWRIRLVEAAAAAAISLAFAAAAARHGSTTPGVGAVVATVLTLAVGSGLALRIPWLPQLGNPHHDGRWLTVIAIALTAAYWWSRDPASRGLPLGRAHSPGGAAVQGARRASPTRRY
ncbi:MAG: hypothetical protein OEW29_09190 [Acidimicrobiia bacterium]|nr:hypothetical protein [Acidimicrobiia bacterium]